MLRGPRQVICIANWPGRGQSGVVETAAKEASSSSSKEPCPVSCDPITCRPGAVRAFKSLEEDRNLRFFFCKTF